jgi:hypothetical protein
MMMGKKKPNMPEIAGGNTPETNVKEKGEVSDHSCRKGTYTLTYYLGLSAIIEERRRNSARNLDWQEQR